MLSTSSKVKQLDAMGRRYNAWARRAEASGAIYRAGELRRIAQSYFEKADALLTKNRER